jgi:pimeloyl-ACP methyl ester carboxylesterase
MIQSAAPIQRRTCVLHGRQVAYVQEGNGPVLLLIHGIAGTLDNWEPVIEPLARNHTVLAPDLPGHGGSEPGAGDYSLGALAAGLRDLLVALGHDRATLVGHSLGGGIAMQFAYQFPEVAERLVLVCSGGLGGEVSLILRAATLPGSGSVIAATAALATVIGRSLGRGLAAVGLRPTPDVAEIARGYASLADRERRTVFLTTLRTVVGAGGQRMAGGDRFYLTGTMPVLIIWGARDPIIPVRHGELAHAAIPASRLEIFEGAGHLPQLESPARFVSVLERFIAETEPAAFDLEQWRGRLRSVSGPPSPRRGRGRTPRTP